MHEGYAHITDQPYISASLRLRVNKFGLKYTPPWTVGCYKEENKMAINAKVILLAEFGPHLGRPYVDTVHGSKYKNTVFRILFCFDKSRNCWLLIGGNKI
jgi:hypothetical protein